VAFPEKISSCFVRTGRKPHYQRIDEPAASEVRQLLIRGACVRCHANPSLKLETDVFVGLMMDHQPLVEISLSKGRHEELLVLSNDDRSLTH
jgi:hypothetical protein